MKELSEPSALFLFENDIEREFLEDDKTPLVVWLNDNKERFPWVYFEEEVETAKKNKHIFYILKENDCIIGYVKIGIGINYIHDFKKKIRFPEETAFIYDTFVMPEYRGKKLALFSLYDIFIYLRNKKIKKIICHIEKWNKPSIRVFENAGFRMFENIRFVRVAWFSLFLRNKMSPFFDFEKYLRGVCLR